jgi:hypothetical protein
MDRQTERERQTDDLISLTFLFKESRLKEWRLEKTKIML